MADLANIIKIMDIKVDNPAFNNKVSGKKRRYWLSDNNEETTRHQQENNTIATRQQLDIDQRSNKITLRKQQENIEIATKQQRDSDQDYNGVTFSTEDSENVFSLLIDNLIGLQKKLFNYILNLCLERDESNTGHISTLNISEAIGCSYGTTKVMIARLGKKGLIKRLKGKGCRGGFVNFEVPKNIKILAIKAIKLERKRGNNEITSGQQTDIDRENINHSSSSNILNTTTTKEEISPNKHQLSVEWRNLDIEPLAHIGFTKMHLFQIASQNKLSIQVVQDSIYSFAFDLEKNDKTKSIKGDPLTFFMGILSKGKIYIPPSNYESPQDKSLRIYLERMKEIKQGREAIEKESKNLAYKEWFSKLTDDQKRELLPEPLRRSANLEKNKFLEGGARERFETEVWPSKKKEIVQEVNITEQGEGKEEKK